MEKKKVSILGKTLREMVRELKSRGKYPLKRDKLGRMCKP